MTSEPKQDDRRQLRSLVRGAYDVQKLRIEMGNRIVANFKAKLGQKPGKKESELDTKGKALLADLRSRYKKLTDGVKTFPRPTAFDGDEVISTYTELCLLAQYVSLEEAEDQHFRRLGKVVEGFEVWDKFLADLKGVGPAMAGVIISEIDIHKARHPSSLWAYAGLDVADDGRGRSRKKEHLVEREYTDKNGNPATRVGITFNPFLKTKLVGVLGSSFLRAGREYTADQIEDRETMNAKDRKDMKPEGPCKSVYATIYYDYKNRLEQHAKWGVQNDEIKDDAGHKLTSKGRRHNMATRYMIKMFLIDLYAAWRGFEGLPVSKPYHEAKLGLKHAGEPELRSNPKIPSVSLA